MPVPNQDKVGGLHQEGIRRKNGDDGGGLLISLDGVAAIACLYALLKWT